MRWNPGNESTPDVLKWVTVSPTGAPRISLMPATIKPTSPALKTPVSFRFGVNTPTLSTTWDLPIDLATILFLTWSVPCMTRTKDTTPK